MDYIFLSSIFLSSVYSQAFFLVKEVTLVLVDRAVDDDNRGSPFPRFVSLESIYDSIMEWVTRIGSP